MFSIIIYIYAAVLVSDVNVLLFLVLVKPSYTNPMTYITSLNNIMVNNFNKLTLI